jgi:hypothetical protein
MIWMDPDHKVQTYIGTTAVEDLAMTHYATVICIN